MYSKIIMVLLALTIVGTASVYADESRYMNIPSDCVEIQISEFHWNLNCDWNWYGEGFIPTPTPEEEPETPAPVEDPPIEDEEPTPEVDTKYNPDLNDDGELDVLEDALLLKERYCNKENPQGWEIETCDALKEATTCESGLREARGAQTYRIYITTDMVFSIWTHWKLDTKPDLSNIKKANEECRAQEDTLEPLIFGPEYDNRADADEVIDLDHQERAVDIFQPIHPQAQTDATKANSIKVAEDAKCANRNFISSWVDWECPNARIQVYTGVGIDVGGDNVVEHLKYLENPTTYMPPVIKGWFKVGDGDWVISLP